MVPDLRYEAKRILIWGKTYPELSENHFETVCTGGVTESGDPVRLYPIDFRYLAGDQQFAKYEWITAEIARDWSDPRLESHRVRSGTIQRHEVVKPNGPGWPARAEHVFRSPAWQFDSVEELWQAQAARGTSIGVVKPAEVLDVHVVPRPESDRCTFEEKLARLKAQAYYQRSQLHLFEELTPRELKELDFVESRIGVRWRCAGPGCKTHTMQVLDWEVVEATRKLGAQTACDLVASRLDLTTYDVRLFLGNLRTRLDVFLIVGIWYPEKEWNARLF